jgi:hypothetical protein
MKQTAVEWLVDKYIIVGGITKTMVKQAKAMEKEQIVNAFSEGTRMIDVNDEMSAMFNGIIYYGENYEQDKQG